MQSKINVNYLFCIYITIKLREQDRIKKSFDFWVV